MDREMRLEECITDKTHEWGQRRCSQCGLPGTSTVSNGGYTYNRRQPQTYRRRY